MLGVSNKIEAVGEEKTYNPFQYILAILDVFYRSALFLDGNCNKQSFYPQVSSVQSLSCVRLFVTRWIAACQASLSITNSRSLLRLMFIDLVIPSNHLILSHPLLLPPSIFPRIRVFSSESVLCIRWPKYWSFSFSISPSNEYQD